MMINVRCVVLVDDRKVCVEVEGERGGKQEASATAAEEEQPPNDFIKTFLN